MPKAAIAIDDWKLPIFERHLTVAGYEWEQYPGLTENTLTLTVTTPCLNALAVVVREANTEAATRRM